MPGGPGEVNSLDVMMGNRRRVRPRPVRYPDFTEQTSR